VTTIPETRSDRETALLLVGRIADLLDQLGRLHIDQEAAAELDSIYPILRRARTRLEAAQ
jgi:hypothetical protein